ncbi:BCCT family transporter [Anaerococcus sp.]|uniref:BCCT family transporter n=1 Tax=Anaerococcus sp. TaxID=1872515 RepID=UPI00359F8EAA
MTPSNKKKIVWGALLALIAISLLFSGGLTALENTLIIVALPFSLAIIFMMISLLIELKHEKNKMGLSITPDRLPKTDQPFKSYSED